MDLIVNRLDMSVRFGNLPDSNLVTKFIRPNYRVLVASKATLKLTERLSIRMNYTGTAAR